MTTQSMDVVIGGRIADKRLHCKRGQVAQAEEYLRGKYGRTLPIQIMASGDAVTLYWCRSDEAR